MDDYQHRSFPWLEFIGVCLGLLMIFGVMAMGAEAGGKNSTETHVLSDNRIFSPETTIIVNSNNAPVTGDRNTVISSNGQTLCADPNAPGQYHAAACNGRAP